MIVYVSIVLYHEVHTNEQEVVGLKKSDLKTGHIIKLRNGDISLVLRDTTFGDVITDQYSWMELNHNDDLTDCDGCRTLDIVSVYEQPKQESRDLETIFNLVKNETILPIWKREVK